MQDKASRPLIETLSMTLGKPYTDDPGTPQNIEIPLQVALPDGQVLYAAVALGGLPFHGQQQIAERIAAAWNAFAGVATSDISAPGQCLHQIQEPEADIWPCVNIDVDESGKITNAKLYSPGLPAGNHDVYPVRVPYMDEHTEAWRACVDELEKAVPGFMSLGNMNGIECAVSAIRGLSERAKHQEPAAAEQAAWHAGLDEGRAQAAPAAVAVPERWCPDVCPITGRRFFGWIEHWKTRQQVPTYGGPFDSYTIPVKDKDGTFSCERFDHDAGEWMTEGMGWCDLGLQLVDDQAFVVQPDNPRYDEIRDFAEGRAALATPAQSVVLPEHAAVVTFEWRKKPDVKWLIDTVVRGTKLYTEQQVRALLAGVSAPAALAVERGEVLVTVSGFTGSGKSAIAGEIEIMCRALGLQVEWPDSDSEKHMTHADWIAALEQYKPRVRIVECNVPHSVVKGQDK